MTKHLLIMRHAKSSWSHSGLTDHQRPLNKRGLNDVPRMAQLLSVARLAPELIVSSTAKRAQTTARLLADYCLGAAPSGAGPILETTDEFYHAPANVYLRFAANFADDVGIAMAVGHNPGMEDLVEMLSGEYERMPTAAIAHVIFDVEQWPEITVENCSLQSVWRPKEILSSLN